MLHSGQSPSLQPAVAQALGGWPEHRAALAPAPRPMPSSPLRCTPWPWKPWRGPPGALAPAPRGRGGAAGPGGAGGWNDRSPWAARLRVAQALLAVNLHAPEVWQELAGLVNEALGEKRSPSAWTADELHQVQARGPGTRAGAAQGSSSRQASSFPQAWRARRYERVDSAPRFWFAPPARSPSRHPPVPGS